MEDKNPEIIEGEVEEVAAVENPPTNDATLLLRIEEMIRTHISQIDDLGEKVSEHKDMLEAVFINDETYQEHDKLAKEAGRVRTNTKKEIMKQSAVAEIAAKLKEMKSEQSELKEGLSDYLREYQRLSGSNEIEGEDGEVREIVYVAKLVKKGKYRP